MSKNQINDIVKQIEELSVLEVSELVKALEDKFGVSATAAVAVAGPAPTTEAGQAEIEEKDIYTVVLTEAAENKVAVIKAVRQINPDLGLKDAKELVDNLPANIAEDVKTDTAKEMQKKLEVSGAKVELK